MLQRLHLIGVFAFACLNPFLRFVVSESLVAKNGLGLAARQEGEWGKE
jgi:hypothetical protein